MKKILNISFIFLFVLGFMSCTNEESDTLTSSGTAGGLLDVKTSSLSYIQGSAATDLFSSNLGVFQGREKVESVDVYKQFFRKDSSTGEEILLESNKALYTSFTFPVEEQYENYKLSFSYNDLIADLVFEDAALPTDDALLLIGDYWILSYVAHLTDGTTIHVNAKTTKVTVSCGSFLAGDYIVNYTSGPKIHTVTEIGDGLYEMSSMFGWPTSGYKVRFTDVCGKLVLLNSWQFSNEIGGKGLVQQPSGDLLWTDVFVADVYTGRTYPMIKQ